MVLKLLVYSSIHKSCLWFCSVSGQLLLQLSYHKVMSDIFKCQSLSMNGADIKLVQLHLTLIPSTTTAVPLVMFSV